MIEAEAAEKFKSNGKGQPLIISCAICAGQQFDFRFDGEDRLYHLPGHFKVFQCRQCGLLFVNPPLSEAQLVNYYPTNYYSYESAQLVNALRTKREKIVHYLRHPLQALNCLFYSKLLGHNRDLPAGPLSRVLDIGCGEGRYLLEKRQSGAQCFGVDVQEAPLERLRNMDPAISTHCGNVWGASYPENHFDLVNLCHVLEHAIEIERLLVEIKRILKPSGLLRIQVPNAASLSFRIFQKYWMPLDVPRHVFIFSANNLKILFDKVGLEIVQFRTLENSFSVLGSSIYVFSDLFSKKNELMRLKRFWDSELLKLLLLPYSFLVNLFCVGDSVEFILKKTKDAC